MVMDTLLLGCNMGPTGGRVTWPASPAGRPVAAWTCGRLLCAVSSIPPASGSAGHCGHPGLGV